MAIIKQIAQYDGSNWVTNDIGVNVNNVDGLSTLINNSIAASPLASTVIDQGSYISNLFKTLTNSQYPIATDISNKIGTIAAASTQDLSGALSATDTLGKMAGKVNYLTKNLKNLIIVREINSGSTGVTCNAGKTGSYTFSSSNINKTGYTPIFITYPEFSSGNNVSGVTGQANMVAYRHYLNSGNAYVYFRNDGSTNAKFVLYIRIIYIYTG